MSSEGLPITTGDQWFQNRRPQFLSLFGNLVYGTVPVPESPIKVTFDVGKTAPAFFQLSFDNTRGDRFDPHPDRPGHLRNGVPLVEVFQRGFGFVSVYQGDLVRHNEAEFPRGIHPLFCR